VRVVTTRRLLALAAAAVLTVGVLSACGSNGATTTVTVTVTAPTSTTSTPSTPTGPAIAELQRVMTKAGYYSGPIDGIYGPATTEGVKKMQSALGVTADGIYGPETHAALGDKGTYVVVEIQTALAEYGYYQGAIDGVYGTETTAAVQQLQTDLGLTADGRFGPETANAFNEAVASGKLKPV
jgi:peptidoglycan hydrolase-like protein with peptidoglycan-binding domain